MVKRWKVSDVVRAELAARTSDGSIGRDDIGDAEYILHRCAEGQAFLEVFEDSMWSMPAFFRVRGHERMSWRTLRVKTEAAIVAAARRLNVPRNA